MNTLRGWQYLVTIILLALPVAIAFGQDLTNEQRLQRCGTNQARIRELEKEQSDLMFINSQGFENRARSTLSTLNQAIANGRISALFSQVSNRKEFARYVNVPWNNGWEADAMGFQRAMRTRLTELIVMVRGKTSGEIEARHRFLAGQVYMYRSRLKELRCDEKTVADDNKNVAIDLSGTWTDEWGYTITLKYSSGSITGTFTGKGNTGNITSGGFDSRTCKVTFDYNEPWKTKNGKIAEGRVEHILSSNGNSMHGGYVSNDPRYPTPQTGSWNLFRSGAKAGCTLKQ